MIIEKPSNRDEWRRTDTHDDYLYQPSVDGVKAVGTDLLGKKIVGLLVAVNDAGAPVAIISDGKLYERCSITGYFYRNDLTNCPFI